MDNISTHSPAGGNITDMDRLDRETFNRHPLVRLGHQIQLYTIPVIIIIGTIGNVLIVLVMARKEFRKHVTSWSFIALAFADLITLDVAFLRFWLIEAFNIDVRLLSNWGCKVHVYLTYWVSNFSVWVVVILTWQRVLAICFPVQSKRWITKAKTAVVLGIVALILLGLYSIFTALAYWSERKCKGVCK